MKKNFLRISFYKFMHIFQAKKELSETTALVQYIKRPVRLIQYTCPVHVTQYETNIASRCKMKKTITASRSPYIRKIFHKSRDFLCKFYTLFHKWKRAGNMPVLSALNQKTHGQPCDVHFIQIIHRNSIEKEKSQGNHGSFTKY